jgi:hypothetical protein
MILWELFRRNQSTLSPRTTAKLCFPSTSIRGQEIKKTGKIHNKKAGHINNIEQKDTHTMMY